MSACRAFMRTYTTLSYIHHAYSFLSEDRAKDVVDAHVSLFLSHLEVCSPRYALHVSSKPS